jgi:hypothetical protein
MQAQNGVVQGIPNGAQAKIVAIAVNGSGTLFHYYDELSVSSNQTVMIEMSAIGDPDLTNILDSL